MMRYIFFKEKQCFNYYYIRYPLITVTKGTESGTYILQQSRFLLQSKTEAKNTDSQSDLWFVPLSYLVITSGETQNTYLDYVSHSITSFKPTINRPDQLRLR